MNSENCEVLTFANSLIKIIPQNVLGIALNTTIMLSKWKFYCPLTTCQSLMDLISTDKLPNWQRGLLRGKETPGDLELGLPYSPWLSLCQQPMKTNQAFPSRIVYKPQNQCEHKSNLLTPLLFVYISLLMKRINENIYKTMKTVSQSNLDLIYKFNRNKTFCIH